jgi:hypothetical protein
MGEGEGEDLSVMGPVCKGGGGEGRKNLTLKIYTHILWNSHMKNVSVNF